MGNTSSRREPVEPAPAHDVWVAAEGELAERVRHIGLHNPTGANNCFLNVSLQALWHVAAFRHALMDAPPHMHAESEACMTCALRELYTFFKFAQETSVPPDSVRAALARLHAAENKFKLGDMADASETLTAIFTALHVEALREQGITRFRMPLAMGGGGVAEEGLRKEGVTTPTSSASMMTARSSASEVADGVSPCSATSGPLPDAVDVACDPPCAAHSAFGYEFFSWYRCISCHASSELMPGSDMMYQVYVADVAAMLERMRAERAAVVVAASSKAYDRSIYASTPTAAASDAGRLTLGYLLGNVAASDIAACAPVKDRDPHAGADGTQNPDAGACVRRRCVPERYALSLPRVFAISLVWPSETTTKEEAQETMDLLGQILDVRTVFRVEPDGAATAELSQREGTPMARSASGAHVAPRAPHHAYRPRSMGGTLPDLPPQLARKHLYRLRGIVCYYGKHYVCFMASEHERKWMLFDDTRLAIVGSWSDVVSRCVRSRYQPTLLFYEQLSGSEAASSARRVETPPPAVAPSATSHAPPPTSHAAPGPSVAASAHVAPSLLPRATDVMLPGTAATRSNVISPDLLDLRGGVRSAATHAGTVPATSTPADVGIPILKPVPAPMLETKLVIISLGIRYLQDLVRKTPERVSVATICGLRLEDAAVPSADVLTPRHRALQFAGHAFSVARVTRLDLEHSLYGNVTLGALAKRSDVSITTVRPGDILVRVDHTPVSSVAEADAALLEALQSRVARTVLPGHDQATFTLSFVRKLAASSVPPAISASVKL